MAPDSCLANTYMITLQRFLQNILLLLTTLVLIALAGETAVRLLTDLSPPLFRRDSELGMTFRKNIDREITGPESGRRVRIKTNEYGFRTPDRPLAKPPGTVRLAIIGDSQIAAVNTRTADTLPVLLEEQLNRRYPQVRWEVFNFGIDGANTAQEFNLYRKLVNRFEVDGVVLAYFNGNDFSDNSIRLSRNPRIYMDVRQETNELVTLYPAPSRRRISNWLNEHSRLYVWQKYFLNDALNNFLAAGGAGKDQKIPDEFLIFVDDPNDGVLEYTWRINELILNAFHREATGDNVFFLLFSIPSSLETTPALWERFRRTAAGTSYADKIDRRLPERRLHAFAKRHGIPHLFLRPFLEEHLQRIAPGNPAYQVAYRQGMGHLNEAGHRLMAEALLDYLEDNKVIGKLLLKNTGRQTHLNYAEEMNYGSGST